MSLTKRALFDESESLQSRLPLKRLRGGGFDDVMEDPKEEAPQPEPDDPDNDDNNNVLHDDCRWRRLPISDDTNTNDLHFAVD